MSEMVKTNVADFRQYIADYAPPDAEGDDIKEDVPTHYLYWDRENKWNQKERLVLWFGAEKTFWFLKKRKDKRIQEQHGDMAASTILAVDMLHKFFIDEDA